MSPMTLEQQLLIAHLAVKRGWVQADDLERALHAWNDGSLLGCLLAHGLLPIEQVRLLRNELGLSEGSELDSARTGPFVPGDRLSGTSAVGASFTGPRYAKIRPHAKGGLGEVFVARDEELQREVALKEIQDRFADHPEARSRFVREAEITGNLEHPGIVPVYGLGLYPDGRPYYAMRFIRGESLQAAIGRWHNEKQNPATLRQLLNRFVAVCNAVAFAHSRGVIHRDIKPANIMLGDFGETLLVDWGLARASGVASAPREGETSAGVDAELAALRQPCLPGLTHGPIGTPAYMSPEQAMGLNERVGPASDVFSLGATLYCLLTGQGPYTGPEVLSRAVACRWSPARQVNKEVPRALEAICARAMAEEPARRYGAVRELASEVEAWLADEPVKAHREPLWDRARRWGRRHRTLVTSGVVLLLASVVGLAVGLRAVSAEQRKTAEERDNAVDAQRRAEASLKLAKEAVNKTFDLAKENPLLKQDAMREVRRLLLVNALPFYKRFPDLQEGAAPVAELADQWARVGYITQEIADKKEARRAYEQSRDLYRQLADTNPEVADYQNDLARSLGNLALLLHQEGRQSEARGAYRRAIEIGEALVKAHPRSIPYRDTLANTLTNRSILLAERGERGAALAGYRRARDIRAALVKDRPRLPRFRNDLAGTLVSMGVLLQAEGKQAEALKAYAQAREINETLAKEHPLVGTYRHDLATALHNIALVLKIAGKRAEALKICERAREIRARLAKDNPRVTEYRHGLAGTLAASGLIQKELGHYSEALAAFAEAKAIGLALVKEHPTVAEYRHTLAATLTSTGNALNDRGKRAEALRAFTEARHLREKLARAYPRVVLYKQGLAETLSGLALLFAVEEKNAEALKVYLRVEKIQRELVESDPRSLTHRNGLARTCVNLAMLRHTTDQPRDALTTLDAGLKHAEAARKIDPDDPTAAELLLRVLGLRGLTLTVLGRHADAAGDWTHFVRIAPPAYRVYGRVQRATSFARAGRAERAMEEAEAIAALPKLQAADVYHLAAIAALCAGVRDPKQPLPRREYLAETCAVAAVDWLKQTHKVGFFKAKANRDALIRNPDFASLRDRDDFKRFLETLTRSQ